MYKSQSHGNPAGNRLKRSPTQAAQYKNLDGDPRGPLESDTLGCTESSPKLNLPIKNEAGRICMPPEERCWSRTQDQWEEMVRTGRAYFGKNGNGAPAFKQYLDEAADIVPNTWCPTRKPETLMKRKRKE